MSSRLQILLGVMSINIVACLAYAIFQPSGSGTTAPNQHVFEFPPAVRAIGDVVSHTFEVQNTTGEQLEIAPISCSCSCTEGSVDNLVIPPGHSSRLRMAMELRKSIGTQRTTCIVRDNLGGSRLFTLRAHVVPKLNVEGKNLSNGQLDLGLITRKSPLGFNLRIVSAGPKISGDPVIDGDLSDITCSIQSLDVSKLQGDLISQAWDAHFSISPGVAGRAVRRIAIGVGSSQERVIVRWNRSSLIKVAPSQFYVQFNEGENSPIERVLTVSTVNGEPVPAFSLSCSSAALSATSERSVTGNLQLSVKVTPEEIESGLSAEKITLSFDDSKLEDLEIPVFTNVSRQSTVPLQASEKN